MATLYVTEFTGMHGNCPVQPAVAEQAVAISGHSEQSKPFQPSTQFVLLSPDQTCSIKFGQDPQATTASQRLSAGSWIPFHVTPGLKVAVIANE